MQTQNFQNFLDRATSKEKTRAILAIPLYDQKKNLYFSSDTYRLHVVKNNSNQLPRHPFNAIVENLSDPTVKQKDYSQVYTSTPFIDIEKFIDIKNHRAFTMPSTISLSHLKEIKKLMVSEAKKKRDNTKDQNHYRNKKIKVNSHFKNINILLSSGIIQYESYLYTDPTTGKEKGYREYTYQFTPSSTNILDNFAINIDYLIDAIQFQAFESTTLYFRDSLSPIIFDDINTLSLIMPLKIS